MRGLGALEPDEIERLFRAADVFAFPSVKEGFGLAALEALAAGLPLVASDLDVFRGFLTDGESALLHPVGDAAALAAALARVARDPALRARLRRGGAEVVGALRLGRVRPPRTRRAYERARERRAVKVTADLPRRLLGDRRRARAHDRRRRARAAAARTSGAMPTELLAPALASCFALALGHVARREGVELPGLAVDVEAERAGRELRYGRMTVTARADVPARARHAVDARQRLCWVSNTFAAPPEIEYRTEDP